MYNCKYNPYTKLNGRSLHTENDDDLHGLSVIKVELVECRWRDHPGLGKSVRGSDVKIALEISQIFIFNIL